MERNDDKSAVVPTVAPHVASANDRRASVPLRARVSRRMTVPCLRSAEKGSCWQDTAAVSAAVVATSPRRMWRIPHGRGGTKMEPRVLARKDTRAAGSSEKPRLLLPRCKPNTVHMTFTNAGNAVVRSAWGSVGSPTDPTDGKVTFLTYPRSGSSRGRKVKAEEAVTERLPWGRFTIQRTQPLPPIEKSEQQVALPGNGAVISVQEDSDEQKLQLLPRPASMESRPRSRKPLSYQALFERTERGLIRERVYLEKVRDIIEEVRVAAAADRAVRLRREVAAMAEEEREGERMIYNPLAGATVPVTVEDGGGSGPATGLLPALHRGSRLQPTQRESLTEMLQEQSRDLAKLMMHRASTPTTKPSIVANAAEATTPQTLPSVMEHCSSPKKGGLVKAGSGCLDDAEASPKSAEGLSSGAEQHDISPLHPPPPMELQARESAVCATPIAVAAGATLTDQKEQQQQYHLLPATVALPAEVVHPAVVETTLMEERKHLEGLRDTLEDVRRLYITLRCARRNIPEALPNKDNDDDDNNNHKNANASKNNKNTNNNYTPLSPRKSTVLTVETYPETRADNADADGAAKE